MKGQWFIISAVIASGVFLAISVLFRDYFLVDSSTIAAVNENFYFKNIDQQLGQLAFLDGGCSDLAKYNQNYLEFKEFAQKKMASIGYFLYIDKNGGCPATFSLLIASERAVIHKNVDPETILVP